MKNNRKQDDQKKAIEQQRSLPDDCRKGKGPDDRRKGIDRRWIKSGYTGPERRSSTDRREKEPQKKGDLDPSRL
jgi:hypothetical protein